MYTLKKVVSSVLVGLLIFSFIPLGIYVDASEGDHTYTDTHFSEKPRLLVETYMGNNNYIVTYKDREGNSLHYKEVEFGETTTYYEPLHKEGYTFVGWYKSSDYLESWNFRSGKIYEDVALYGKWIKNKEPVVFVWGEDVSYRNGNIYNSNDDLIFKIYSQNLFITLDELNQLLDFSTTTINENITIQFAPNVVVVYPSNVTIINLGKIQISNEIHLNSTTFNFGTIQSGKMLLGGQIHNYGVISMFGTVFFQQPNGGITFQSGSLSFINKPIWAEMYFTVIYRDWDGSVILTENTILNHTSIPPEDPSREGYVFVGWDVPLDNITKETIATAKYKQEISGIVEITGTLKFGEELTTDLSEITPAGFTVSYQWHRNGNLITGATNSTYTVAQVDIGQSITVTVTGTGDYIGRITSENVIPKKADGPLAPNPPALASKAATTVILEEHEGYEYRLGNGNWQDSGTFTDLDSITTYAFYQRVATTQTHEASDSSEALEVTTDDYMLGDVNGDGKITTVDALMALQTASGRITLPAQQERAADVNKDGRITTVDALMILQYASGRINSFD